MGSGFHFVIDSFPQEPELTFSHTLSFHDPVPGFLTGVPCLPNSVLLLAVLPVSQALSGQPGEAWGSHSNPATILGSCVPQFWGPSQNL